MTKKLTNRQSEILSFISDQIETGFAPTLREIASHFKFSSSHGALCHLRALEQKGYIERANAKSRAIRLVESISPRDVINAVWQDYTSSGELSSETLKRVEHLASEKRN